jgi:hypothetical protein
MGRWRFAALLIFTLFSILFAIAYPYYSGKAIYLVLYRHAVIEVNGVRVPGAVLATRNVALITRRDSGHEHSYLLAFEGDVDMEGDMGAAIDCHSWVAPRFPLLIVTKDYPPCTGTSSATPGNCKRISIKAMHHAPVAFETPEHEIIGVLDHP